MTDFKWTPTNKRRLYNAYQEHIASNGGGTRTGDIDWDAIADSIGYTHKNKIHGAALSRIVNAEIKHVETVSSSASSVPSVGLNELPAEFCEPVAPPPPPPTAAPPEPEEERDDDDDGDDVYFNRITGEIESVDMGLMQMAAVLFSIGFTRDDILAVQAAGMTSLSDLLFTPEDTVKNAVSSVVPEFKCTSLVTRIRSYRKKRSGPAKRMATSNVGPLLKKRARTDA